MISPHAPGVMPDTLAAHFPAVGFPTALAPMQDVTGLPFMNVVTGYGPPDLFFTEYFRVHAHARVDPFILSSITENHSGKPVFAQLIGEELPHMARFARELQQFPIAGIDLNLGCPAPRVYRKKVGGGLLRDPERVDAVLQTLRAACHCPLTVKTRVGFEDSRNFGRILEIFAKNEVELVSLHARTVKGGYRSIPEYEYVTQAVQSLDCPVLLNGNVDTAEGAVRLKQSTGAAGVMIGRSAIRNPWIFQQIRQLQNGQDMHRPTHADVYNYIRALYDALANPMVPEERQVARLKKFLNFIGLSVDAQGQFLHRMRRTRTRDQLEEVCHQYLLADGRAKSAVHLSPYDGLVARPGTETSGCLG